MISYEYITDKFVGNSNLPKSEVQLGEITCTIHLYLIVLSLHS